MDLTKILEYQKIDKEVYDLENKVKNSDEAKAHYKIQSKLADTTNTLIKMDKETSDLYEQFAKCYQVLRENESKQMKKPSVNPDDVNSLNNFESFVMDSEEFLSTIEKEICKIQNRLLDIKNTAIKLNEEGGKLSKELAVAKDAYMGKMNEAKTNANPYIKDLNELKENIDEKLLTAYNLCRKNKKMPAFVPYLDDQDNKGTCGACGMEVAIEVGAVLKNSGDIAECPNCRRIVYKK